MAASSELVVVALSGGVDSATAAALLVEQGRRVVGIAMRLYDAAGSAASSGGRCCGPRDLEDARRVCAHLGIPFYVANYERAFTEAVVEDFVEEYLAGRTPNPCVRCNERIKFAPLLERARALGATALATGHYARVAPGPDGAPRLLRAIDRDKDQSYFLFGLDRAALERTLFPIGALTKGEVRARARALGLPNAEKPESQEICFVPDGDYAGFVARRAGARAPGPGEIVDVEGRRLGDHGGVHRFTIGQRRGLGALPLAGGAPRYVVALDARAGRVVVGGAAALSRRRVDVAEVRWAAGRAPGGPLRAEVQLRHRHRAGPAEVRPVEGGARAEVWLDAPERAPAPGQAAVFYQGDVVLGGGFIAATA